jgi:hypothetical protein
LLTCGALDDVAAHDVPVWWQRSVMDDYALASRHECSAFNSRFWFSQADTTDSLDRCGLDYYETSGLAVHAGGLKNRVRYGGVQRTTYAHFDVFGN